MFLLMQKKNFTVFYIDSQFFWQNMMSSAVASMPKVIYLSQDQINRELINSVCLIKNQ